MSQERIADFRHLNEQYQWIDERPDSWRVSRVKDFFVTGTGPTLLKEDLTEAGAWPVISASEGTEYFGYTDDPRVRLYPGDMVVTSRGTIGVAKLVHEPSTCTQTTVFLKRKSQNSLDSRFALYFMHGLREEIFPITQTAIPMLTGSQIGNAPILLPSLDQQRAVVDFLDRETAQIDAMVDAQERLVTLLEERRKAVVLESVTSGIGTTRAEPGGSPSHWEQLPIKALGRTQSGAGFPEADQGLIDLPIPFYKVNALGRADSDGVIRERYDTIDANTAQRLRASVIPAGSVVLAKIGAALLLSRFRLLAYDSCIDNNMLAFIPNARVLGRYAMYAFEQLNLDQLVNPGAVPSLSDRVLRDFRLAWPGVGEQAEIVDYLDSATARINTMIAKARESVALMKERRAALISAAVTGRLDVRTGVDQIKRELEEARA